LVVGHSVEDVKRAIYYKLYREINDAKIDGREIDILDNLSIESIMINSIENDDRD